MLGIDIAGARYNGTYASQGTTLVGNVTLTSAGGQLVTGQPVPPGTQVPITFNLPQNFGNGQFQTVTVGGRPVQVAFDKIGEVP